MFTFQDHNPVNFDFFELASKRWQKMPTPAKKFQLINSVPSVGPVTCNVMRAAHLLPSLLRRPLQLPGLVIFGVKQVDVIWGVADQHLSAVLAVAERCHAARLVGQMGGDKPHAHAGSPSAHVVTWGGGGEGGSSVRADDGILVWMCPWMSTAKVWFWLKTTNQMSSSFLNRKIKSCVPKTWCQDWYFSFWIGPIQILILF